MTLYELPSELVSLVHHTELSKIGWWDSAIQNMIVSSLWLAKKEMTIADIQEAMKLDFDINVEKTRIVMQIDGLSSSTKIVETQNATYKISESYMEEISNDLEAIENLEHAVAIRFKSLVTEKCPSLDKDVVWDRFLHHYLVPLVSNLGAHLYELATSTTYQLDLTTSSSSFSSEFPANCRSDLEIVISEFLHPENVEVRSYVLKLLLAHFTIESGNLSDSSIAKISKSLREPVVFNLFVDTNFILSALGLHENPSNDAVFLLLEMIKRARSHITIKMYVTTDTIGEVKYTLGRHIEILRDLRLTPLLSDVAARSELSGFAKKFVEACSKAGKALSVDDYFNPYFKDTLSILRNLGFELYNEDLAKLHASQEVIDDILEQKEYEQKRSKRKSYEQLQHDVVLWHLTKRKRSVHVESPLDARFWVLTIDYSLIRFDTFKRRTGNGTGNIPLCIHPSDLAPLFQFWIPRSVELEQAVFGNLRLPLMLKDFDVESEKITIRILKGLARYENIDDLGKEGITNTLANEALRARLMEQPAEDGDFDLIREVIIDENKILRDSAVAMMLEVDKQKEEIRTVKDESAKWQEEAVRKRSSAETFEEALISEQTANQDLSSEVISLKRNIVLGSFLLGLMLIVGGLIFAGHALHTWLVDVLEWGAISSTIVPLVLAIVFLIVYTIVFGKIFKEIREFSFFKITNKYKWWFISGFFIAPVGGFVSELVKHDLLKMLD